MAERRLRYPLLWLLFIAVMIAGAALISNPSPVLQAVGLAIFTVPLAAFGLLALAYYLVERFRASRGQPK